MRALVFPGQGAQIIGMGQELADAYPAAKAVFEEVNDALKQDLSSLIWDGDIETLTLTENAQPALMATSIAAFKAMEAEGEGLDKASYVAGHSLGEYSALCAAGAISIADTARLLRTRGQAMQSAVPVGEGAMAVVLGFDLEAVRAIAEEAAEGEVCEAANDNDPAQVVLSGHKAAVERAAALAREKGAKRAMLLPVSAPFHCALMAPASKVMREALDAVEVKSPALPLVANVKASAIQDPVEIRDLLVEQVTGSVRWRESVQHLVEQGVDQTVEVGSGKALSGMIRRISKEVAVKAVGKPGDIAALKGEA